MVQLAANLEVLFNEAGPDCVDRAKAAAATGFDAVEMWGSTGKDIPELSRALVDLGLTMTALVAEPNANLVFPGSDLQPFFDGLDRAIDDAGQLACRRIVVRSGIAFPGFNRQRNLDKLVEVYAKAVERIGDRDLVILHEPVNTRADHPGLLVDRTADAVKVIRAVGSPKLRLLFDFYHSAVEGEVAADELPPAADLLEYVQFADYPSRGEPGSGTIDWPASFALLKSVGYTGPIGLEHIPKGPTAPSVGYIMDLAKHA
ncbi:TIM barrel protein [Novosphingobium sp.]|uniref:TIM barrel protein n=1 Tax=Novosphingobium sp. TaxID=1874826 RepID=UPI003D11E6E2